MRNLRSVKRLWAGGYGAGRPQELENEMAPFRRVSILRQLQLSAKSKQFIKRMREHIRAVQPSQVPRSHSSVPSPLPRPAVYSKRLQAFAVSVLPSKTLEGKN